MSPGRATLWGVDGEAAADVPRRRWRWVIGLLAFGVVVVALVGVGAVRTFGIGARACTMMGCVGFVAVDVTAQRDALGDGVVEVRDRASGERENVASEEALARVLQAVRS